MSGWLLIKSDDVSARVAKPRRDLRCVRAYRLNDLASVGFHQLNRRGYAVHHHVHQQAWLLRRRTLEHPRSAHLARRIIKSGAAVAARPDIPSENAFVELG